MRIVMIFDNIDAENYVLVLMYVFHINLSGVSAMLLFDASDRSQLSVCCQKYGLIPPSAVPRHTETTTPRALCYLML